MRRIWRRRRLPKNPSSVLRQPLQLIVGLGNPGERYQGTRHNLGAECLRALLGRHGLEARYAMRYKSEFLATKLYGTKLRCLIPHSFMNLSGQPVARICRFFRIPAEAVLVLHDETAFAPGCARLKQGGGAGGHNGVADVIRAIGPQFIRLRLGVGAPPKGQAAVPWLIHQRPHEEDRAHMARACDLDEDIWRRLILGDVEAAMNRLHAPTSAGI